MHAQIGFCQKCNPNLGRFCITFQPTESKELCADTTAAVRRWCHRDHRCDAGRQYDARSFTTQSGVKKIQDFYLTPTGARHSAQKIDLPCEISRLTFSITSDLVPSQSLFQFVSNNCTYRAKDHKTIQKRIVLAWLWEIGGATVWVAHALFSNVLSFSCNSIMSDVYFPWSMPCCKKPRHWQLLQVQYKDVTWCMIDAGKDCRN